MSGENGKIFGKKQMFYIHLHKGVIKMTSNERELLTLIRESENKERALLTAVLMIGYALENTVPRQQPFSQGTSGDSRAGLA